MIITSCRLRTLQASHRKFWSRGPHLLFNLLITFAELILNRYKEKSRVVRPGPDERNYHIFYQLVAAAQSDPQVSPNP